MKRKPFNFRLSTAGHDWLSVLAQEHDVSLADVNRAALAVAMRHEQEVHNLLLRNQEV